MSISKRRSPKKAVKANPRTEKKRPASELTEDELLIAVAQERSKEPRDISRLPIEITVTYRIPLAGARGSVSEPRPRGSGPRPVNCAKFDRRHGSQAIFRE